MTRKQGIAASLLIQTIICLLPGTARSVAPEIYLPGVISGPVHEAAPAFTPDGQTVYFQRSNSAASVILISHRIGEDAWSKPLIARFSGVWNDLEPAMAPDGSFMLFVSNRPAAEGGKPASGFYNGKPQMGGNLWRIDRVADRWSVPIRLPDTVNRSSNVFAPSIAGTAASTSWMLPARMGGSGYSAPNTGTVLTSPRNPSRSATANTRTWILPWRPTSRS